MNPCETMLSLNDTLYVLRRPCRISLGALVFAQGRMSLSFAIAVYSFAMEKKFPYCITFPEKSYGMRRVTTLFAMVKTFLTGCLCRNSTANSNVSSCDPQVMVSIQVRPLTFRLYLYWAFGCYRYILARLERSDYCRQCYRRWLRVGSRLRHRIGIKNSFRRPRNLSLTSLRAEPARDPSSSLAMA